MSPLKPFHAELVEALRRAFRDGATGESPSSIDAETVYRAASGELPEPETRRLIDAMADDPDLAEAWALARELVEAERRAERPATVTAIRRPQAARFGAQMGALRHRRHSSGTCPIGSPCTG